MGGRAHKHESLRLKGYRSSWMCGMKSATQTFHATRAFVRVALFRPDINAHSMLVNAHTHLHYPSQKQWLPGMGVKQEPPRRAHSGAPTCSHESLVGMFSHAHQSPGRETASPDPTRVLTKGESDIEEWHDDTWERRNRPLLSAWGLRLTQIIIAVAILAQAPDLGESRK